MNNEHFRKKKYYIGCFIIGIIGLILFLILTGFSHYYAIQGGYDWTYWELSELVLYGMKGKVLFMTAAIIGGVGIFAMLFPIGDYFNGRKIRITYYILATSVSLLLVLVGAIPEDQFVKAHYIFGLSFFLVDGIIVLFSAIYIHRKFNSISIFYPIFGYISFGVLIFHAATRELFGMAYTQRLAILFSIIYVIIIGERFLLRSENIQEK